MLQSPTLSRCVRIALPLLLVVSVCTARAETPQIDGREALEGLDEKHVVLQLVSYRTLDRARSAVRRFRLRSEARIVENVVKGKRYFVVIYGDYDTEAKARKAIEKLPVTLRRAKPLVRKVSALRAQLEG